MNKAAVHFDVPIPTHGFSFGLLPGPAEVELTPATYSKYNASEFVYFYHTRNFESAAGSTKFRHAPVTNIPANGTSEAQTYNLSSVGFGIDNPVEWNHKYSHSKFCLVIRGDNPGSRALLRAVRVGCIPVIVSDLYPRYAPSYKSTLHISEYAILINETEFLSNPWGELHRVYSSLTEMDIKRKIHAIALAQRVVFPDHPDSLFVPAFLREAWLSIPESDRVVGCGSGCTFMGQ